MNGAEEPNEDMLSPPEQQELKDRLRPPGPVHKGPQCPDEEQLLLAVVGLAEEAETHKLLAHAATCVWCGKILREAAEDLDATPTEDELVVAAKSRLANEENRRAFAERLAGLTRPAPKPPPKLRARWTWWGAAAALAASLGALGIFLWPTSPELLLARAYTEYRPMEMRLPGARYGPVRTERAGGPLPISRSPDLHEAEARILREIETHPDDPVWLHLQGRVHLLTGREDDAIAELERAHALRPKDAYILSDLGSAWFQKAEHAADKSGDLKAYSSAFNLLSQAVRLKPDDATLVFNRALAAESVYAYIEARDAWEAYLRLDSEGPWANEARAHLEAVKKKLERQHAYVTATTAKS